MISYLYSCTRRGVSFAVDNVQCVETAVQRVRSVDV